MNRFVYYSALIVGAGDLGLFLCLPNHSALFLLGSFGMFAVAMSMENPR
jgi:hypothetical protein